MSTKMQKAYLHNVSLINHSADNLKYRYFLPEWEENAFSPAT